MNASSLKKAMFSSATPEWATPQALFDELNSEFHFTLDPCATKENAKCAKFYTKEDDGLKQSWGGQTVFMNPPYGVVIGKWIEKAWVEFMSPRIPASNKPTIVMLLPARTDTKWFHNYIYGKAEIRFIKGRLKFGGSKNSAPFPSMVVIFRPEKREKE